MPDALGMIETTSLPSMVDACDAAVKAAPVLVVAIERIGCALVTCFIRGDVAAVTSAVDAGSRAARAIGGFVASHVIPNPHTALDAVFPLSGRLPGAVPGVDIDCGC